MARILYGKTFGLGNAVMAVSAIKALKSLGHSIDVLVGSSPDDIGAVQVMDCLVKKGIVDTVHVDFTRHGPTGIAPYDVAIMAIPFDGRWRYGIHFQAAQVLDGRPRPDPSTVGLSSWKKHEVEYQMDVVRELGYTGDVPDTSFLEDQPLLRHPEDRHRRIYVGVGYKKDLAGFWARKHWGNENFAALINLAATKHPEWVFVASGDSSDIAMSLAPISRMCAGKIDIMPSTDIGAAFGLVRSCDAYVGNDSGTSHVAASFGRLGVVTVHRLENSITKSHPWCADRLRVDLDGSSRDITPEEVLDALERVIS